MRNRAIWGLVAVVPGVAVGLCLAYCIGLALLAFGIFGVKMPGPLGERGEGMVSVCLVALCVVAGAGVGYRIGSTAKPGSRKQALVLAVSIVVGMIVLLLVLARTLLPNVLTPTVEGQRTETLMRMKHLELCIRSYERRYGYYPPSSFRKAGKDLNVSNNGINEGIECLLVHIRRQSLGGSATLEDKLDWLGNTDNDDGGFSPIESLQATKLSEVLDAWQHPIAYLRADSYGQKHSIAMHGDRKETQNVQAVRDPATHRFLAPRKWQLISAGQDGVFGTEDDISSAR